MTSEEILATIDCAMRDLRETSKEKVTFDNEVPYWPGTIIVHEGFNRCWGAPEAELFNAMRAARWAFHDCRAEPPPGISFEEAYYALCQAVPPRRTMAVGNMEDLKEGHYPDGESWFEMFGSHPAMFVENDGLTYV